ncbi:hypothetical protein AURDEDRAFT_125024 [Auricularia subglabra TFB-10046 SS5]|nr:hypothetical protein AURDEDRAFT_125024 [Auricularia subglabra TFB-10046 SS5]
MYSVGQNPGYVYLPSGSDLTIEQVAQDIVAAPAVSWTTGSLHLDPRDLSSPIENGAALVAILRQCPNVQILHMRMSRQALDALAGADLVFDRLHTAHLECYDPNSSSAARLLSRMPNLRSLWFVVLGVSLREDEASLRQACHSGLLPHLSSYAQATMSSIYRMPIHAAARTLRSLSLDLHTGLPDLSHLTALTYLSIKVIAQGERLLQTRLVAALAGLRRLRHLEVSYATRMEESVFAAVATLGPQLLRLRLHLISTGSVACGSLALTLPRLLSGPLPSLRALALEIPLAEPEHWDVLTRAIDEAVCARRVALELRTILHDWL